MLNWRIYGDKTRQASFRLISVGLHFSKRALFIFKTAKCGYCAASAIAPQFNRWLQQVATGVTQHAVSSTDSLYFILMRTNCACSQRGGTIGMNKTIHYLFSPPGMNCTQSYVATAHNMPSRRETAGQFCDTTKKQQQINRLDISLWFERRWSGELYQVHINTTAVVGRRINATSDGGGAPLTP